MRIDTLANTVQRKFQFSLSTLESFLCNFCAIRGMIVYPCHNCILKISEHFKIYILDIANNYFTKLSDHEAHMHQKIQFRQKAWVQGYIVRRIVLLLENNIEGHGEIHGCCLRHFDYLSMRLNLKQFQFE